MILGKRFNLKRRWFPPVTFSRHTSRELRLFLCISVGVPSAFVFVMRIELHAVGFNLTNYTREFVQSKLRYRLGRFKDHIGSVAVTLSSSVAATGSEAAACDILVHIQPAGEIRLRAEHQWLHVAIDRATNAVAGAIERHPKDRQHRRLTATV